MSLRPKPVINERLKKHWTVLIFFYTGRKLSSGMWRHIDIVLTDVSEERITSIFRVEDKQTFAPAHAGSFADFFLSSTLKMEAIRSSKMSVNIISTRRHIPDDCLLHSQRRENLKFTFFCTVS
jgi:hypothetical protein